LANFIRLLFLLPSEAFLIRSCLDTLLLDKTAVPEFGFALGIAVFTKSCAHCFRPPMFMVSLSA